MRGESYGGRASLNLQCLGINGAVDAVLTGYDLCRAPLFCLGSSHPPSHMRGVRSAPLRSPLTTLIAGLPGRSQVWPWECVKDFPNASFLLTAAFIREKNKNDRFQTNKPEISTQPPPDNKREESTLRGEVMCVSLRRLSSQIPIAESWLWMWQETMQQGFH